MTPCRLARIAETNTIKENVVFTNGEYMDGKIGEGYTTSSLNRFALSEFLNDGHDNAITRVGNKMVKKLEDVLDDVDEATCRFGNKLDQLREKEMALAETSKKVMASVKDSANKLADALQKVETRADFDRLERIVTLLERASYAMSTIAQLEEDGKLGKIVEALK